MPISGFTRFRKHQVGVQASFGSNTTATRVLPYRGAIVVDPAPQEPDVDVGSLDPVMASFDGASTYTGSWDGPLAYDDAPYLWAALLKGGVTPTGATAKDWIFQAASLSADPFAYVTDEWGDDVTNDWIIGGSGILESLEMSFDESLGAYQINAETVYARAQIGTGPTGGLLVDETPVWVYGADTEVFLDTVPGSIGTTKLVDAIHGATISVTGNNDQKRFANGSNSRFQLAGYGRGPREMFVNIVVAKTAATVAERATVDDRPRPVKYLELRATSPEVIPATAVPYSQSVRVRGELVSAEDGELGGNTTITLRYRVKYDSTLGYAIRARVVCALAAL